MITTICEIKKNQFVKLFLKSLGGIFPSWFGGQMSWGPFFQLLIFQQNQSRTSKKGFAKFLSNVGWQKKIHSNKRHQFNLSKYVEPISSSSSYEFIITLLYTPKQAFVKKCIHWYSRFRVKLILKNKDHYFLLTH